LKSKDCLILSTSPPTQPARKHLRIGSLALRRRLSYKKTRCYFTGKEPDPETGLYYFGARYLDPKVSRWISGDPALERALFCLVSGRLVGCHAGA